MNKDRWRLLGEVRLASFEGTIGVLSKQKERSKPYAHLCLFGELH